MSRYKILKSVAHNWASSTLSLEYLDDRGYLAQYLVDAAREHRSPIIEYEPLEGAIRPPEIATPGIANLLEYASSGFLRILEAQGCSRDMVSSACLRVEYSTLEPCPVVTKVYSGWSFSDPWKAPECVPYRATCTIEDDKARSHMASVREWWRPEGAA